MSEKKKIYVLVGIIIFICVAIFSLNLILNKIDKENQKEKEAEKIENPINPFENLSEIDKINNEKEKEKIVKIENNIERKVLFNFPKAENNAKLIFIFDDAGQNEEFLSRYLELPFPFTVAVLPGLAKSFECAELVRNAKKELILHQPMQAENLEINPGPKAITATMSTKDISNIVKENIKSLGANVKGINNHEGSLITSNIIKIGAVLEVCSDQKLYFIDSKTTKSSKVKEASLELGTKYLERNVSFLDNVVEREQILQRFYECLEHANKYGKALIFSHIDKCSDIIPELFKEMYPELLEAGYTFALPSEILEEENK